MNKIIRIIILIVFQIPISCSPKKSNEIQKIDAENLIENINRFEFRAPQQGETIFKFLNLDEKKLVFSDRGYRHLFLLDKELQIVLISQETKKIESSIIDDFVLGGKKSQLEYQMPIDNYVAIELYRNGVLLVENRLTSQVPRKIEENPDDKRD